MPAPSVTSGGNTFSISDTGLLVFNDSNGDPQPVTLLNGLPTVAGTPTASSSKSLTLLTASFNRTANTDNYAVNEIVATATSGAVLNELANAALATGRGGVLQSLTLWKSGTGVTGAVFEVQFYSSSAAAIPAQDGGLENILVANTPYFLGAIQLPAMATGAGASNTGAKASALQVALPYSCAATSLYWTVKCLSAYTDEASGETFTLAAGVIRD